VPAASSDSQVADFIRALALAWKNLAAYPPGHPALAGAVESAHRALTDLRGRASDVSLGIAADGIIFRADKIDTAQAQKFAQALYSRRVAIVRLAAQTSVRDLETFLRLLSGVPGEKTAAMWDELDAAGVTSIALQPVDYSAVQVTDNLKTPEAQKPARESLWDEILRALVAGHELSPKAQQLLSRDIRSVDELSALVLRYIDTIDDDTLSEFDPDATFGVRLHVRRGEASQAATERMAEAIGAHVGASQGLRRQLAVQQIIQLLRSMPEPLRGAIMRSVLKQLATDETAASALRELAETLGSDELIAALRHVSTIAKLSPHAVTLLQSLVALQEKKIDRPQPAPATVIGELVNLLGDDDVDRFNPPDHQTLLKNVAIEVPRADRGAGARMQELGSRMDTVAPEAIDRQLAAAILEMLAKYGATRDADRMLSRVESAFRSQITASQFGAALDILERLHEIAGSSTSVAFRESIGRSIARLAATETMHSLVDALTNAPPEKHAVIYRLIDGLGAVATRNLLLALSEADNRSRRRRLFDLMSSLGPRIVVEVIHFLADDRWYVVRNMILLLRTVNDRTSLPEIRRLAQHPDLRVRLEAIKTLLAFDTSVPRKLLEDAINDRDPKLAETAVALVGNYGIKEGVDPLLQIVARRDLFGTHRPLRIRAIKALGELADPAALPRMEHLFSTSVLPWPHREERFAAFESLAAYPPEARAPFVARGLRSRDAVIREICRRLSEP
jgi:HEAT repeat protein